MEPRRLYRAGARPLRRLPYAARSRFPGEGDVGRGLRRPVLSCRRDRGGLARAKPARAVDAAGHGRDAQDRAQPLRRGVGQHGGRGPAQHAVHERRRSAGRRRIPRVAARRRARQADAGAATPGAGDRASGTAGRRYIVTGAGRSLHVARRAGLPAVLQRLPPLGRRRRAGRLSAAGGQRRAAVGGSVHAGPYHADRLAFSADGKPCARADDASVRATERPGDRGDPELRAPELGPRGRTRDRRRHGRPHARATARAPETARDSGRRAWPTCSPSPTRINSRWGRA